MAFGQSLVEFKNLFAPPQQPLSQVPYETQEAQVKRNQALADMLAEQSRAAIPIQSYKGIQAPVPWTSILAKALQGAGAAYKRGRAESQEADIAKQDKQQLQAQADLYAQVMAGGAPGAPGAPPVAPPQPGAVASPAAPPPGAMPPTGGPSGPAAPPGAPMSGGPPPMPGAAAPGAPAPAGGAPTRQQFIAALMRGDGGPQAKANAQMLIPLLMQRDEKLEDRAYNEQRAKVRPLNDDERAKYKIDPKTPAVINADGVVTTINDQNQITTFQAEQLKNDREQIGISRGNLGVAQGNLALARQQANRPIAYGANTTLIDPNTHKVIGTTAPTIKEQQEMVDRTNSQKNSVVSSDTALSSMDTLMGNKSGFESAVGFPDNPVSGLPWLGGFSGTARKDFESQLETLKAQTFLPMVQQMRNMGALSDAEGKKLSAAVGALDAGMSEEAFKSSATAVYKQLLDARNRLPGAAGQQRQMTRQPWMVKRTGTDSNGKKVVEYYDGVVENAP